MCPRCEGMGSVTDFDLTQLYDSSKSIREGALKIPGYQAEGWYGRIYGGSGFFPGDKPIEKFTDKQLRDLLYKEPTRIKVEGINVTFEGLIPRMQKSFLQKDVETSASRTFARLLSARYLLDLPRVRRHSAQRGGPLVQDQGHQHRGRVLDAGQSTWPNGFAD